MFHLHMGCDLYENIHSDRQYLAYFVIPIKTFQYVQKFLDPSQKSSTCFLAHALLRYPSIKQANQIITSMDMIIISYSNL